MQSFTKPSKHKTNGNPKAWFFTSKANLTLDMNEKLQEVVIQIISTPKPYQRRPAPLMVRLWNCPRISAAIRWEDRNVKWLILVSFFFTLGWDYFLHEFLLIWFVSTFALSFIFFLMQLKWLQRKNLSALAKINSSEISANWSQRPEDKQKKNISAPVTRGKCAHFHYLYDFSTH